MELFPKLIADPLNNKVLVEKKFSEQIKLSGMDNVTLPEEVITDPAYIIEVPSQALFYFKPIDWDMNLLIEAEAIEGVFVARHFKENPSVDYIAQLLKKGRLFRFDN